LQNKIKLDMKHNSVRDIMKWANDNAENIRQRQEDFKINMVWMA